MNTQLRLWVLLLLTASCTPWFDTDPGKQTPDAFYFGSFFGMCIGNGCVDVYKLSAEGLFEDKSAFYPGSESVYDGDFVRVDDAFLAEARALQNLFPEGLLDEKDQTIGAPDAGDWGGYLIAWRKDGVTRVWLVDKMRENVPAKYHPFLEALDALEITLENRSGPEY
jgi:hypothetical protein